MISKKKQLEDKQKIIMPGKIPYLYLYMCDSLQEVHLNFQLLLYSPNDFVSLEII